MTIIACGQDEICPDECANCGFWLSSEIPGGVPGPFGRYCTEDCAADAAHQAVLLERQAHLYHRDLLCACAEVCAPNGHPTAAEVAEYRAYVEATHGG